MAPAQVHSTGMDGGIIKLHELKIYVCVVQNRMFSVETYLINS